MLDVKNAEAALCKFMDLFMDACDKHAPMKKISVKNIRTPWLDHELKNSMKERDRLKTVAVASGNWHDWRAYQSFRNTVTKMNRQKKNSYQSKLEEYKGDSKKLWKTLNEVIGKTRRSKIPNG